MTESTSLTLEEYGTVTGRVRSPGETFGETVFTTAQTGYEESITDPSYTGQILVFAYPLIGNYGVERCHFESAGPCVEGVIAGEMTDDVADWLKEHDIPAIDHVDTRDLVLHIRDNGSSEAAIGDDSESLIEETPDFEERADYIKQSTQCREAVEIKGSGPLIGFIDCGAKQGIVESFKSRDAHLVRYPHTVSTQDIIYDQPDLLFVSNGPGNPEWFTGVQQVVRELRGQLPMAGICLGQQIIALALGGETEKMEFGHHGINQPVIEVNTGRVKITTQNHGYVVSDPGDLVITEENVNDGSCEGLEHVADAILTKQYHPEGRPGPQDSSDFFDTVLGCARDSTGSLGAVTDL